MNNRNVVASLLLTGFMALMAGLGVIVYLPGVTAAETMLQTPISHTTNTTDVVTSEVAPTPLTRIYSIPAINSSVVALVMQPGDDKLHAFNALTGEWATLEGPDFKVEGDDLAYTTNLVALVAQLGQDKLHAFSALTGQWVTLSGETMRVGADDVIKVHDAVIIVAQPKQEQIHAFSALTGQWSTLGGDGFNVASDNVFLVGQD